LGLRKEYFRRKTKITGLDDRVHQKRPRRATGRDSEDFSCRWTCHSKDGPVESGFRAVPILFGGAIKLLGLKGLLAGAKMSSQLWFA